MDTGYKQDLFALEKLACNCKLLNIGDTPFICHNYY